MAPTAQELEELFEELEGLSDSGPEMVMDNLSIVSNPRPGLRPYFASTSSREILPAINDERVLRSLLRGANIPAHKSSDYL